MLTCIYGIPLCLSNLGLREIRDLSVRCDNAEEGCIWEGTVGTLEDHMTKCDFTPVSCPKRCNIGAGDIQLTRKTLADHLQTKCPNRDHHCKCCGEKGTYASIVEEHDQVCIKKLVSCPNSGCAMTMERWRVSEHITDVCKLTVVNCKYHNIGCDVRMMRTCIEQHEEENDKYHFQVALEKNEKLNSTIFQMFKDISMLKDTTDSQGKTLSSLKESISSQEGAIAGLKKTTSLLKSDFILQNDNFFTFKLTEYTDKVLHSASFYSEPFYTSLRGYRMCIRVEPGGDNDGEGTHVSVYSMLLGGHHDRDLKWPFVGSVTVELLNQLADHDHHSMAIPFKRTDNNKVGSAWGYHTFIPHSKLSRSRNTQYLVKNTLYFRATVDVQNHKQWLDGTKSRV